MGERARAVGRPSASFARAARPARKLPPPPPHIDAPESTHTANAVVPQSSRPAKRAPEPGAAPPRYPILRRIPWVAVALTLLVLVAALFATAPLRDAVTRGPVLETALVLGGGYVALAPLSDILDTLSLFTIAQHVAVLITLFVVYAAWRALTLRGLAPAVGRARREAGRATLFVLLVALVYVAGILLPRPMARLSVTTTNVLAVDFHTHTQASHDARPGWRVEDVREWHRAAGFDVAYITDHRSLDGAQRAIDGNPPLAGEGTMLLPGIEVVWDGAHVNLLSAGTRYLGLTTTSLRDIDADALRLASLVPNTEPVLVQTIPDDIAKMHPAAGPGTAGVRAIELVDGAPRGLVQSRRDRAAIIAAADSLDLALVAGTDNHGWGRTAPAWTLMRVPGWRGMTGDSLAQSIETFIRRGGRGSTRVVERVVDEPGRRPLRLVVAAPMALWRMMTTLSAEERVAWLAWIWGVTLLWHFLAPRLSPRRTPAA